MNAQGQVTETQGALGPAALAGRRILVIDDEPDFAESLQDLLEADGCRVELLTDAAALEQSTALFEAEVILLDVRLKQANGIDLMDQLRSRWPDARIVIITGFASKDTAIEALKNGAFDYLEKPIHTEELQATIGRALWAYDADLTMRDAHEQMVQSLHKAEAANRSKSVFLANMSHELRTPLNAILGFSEVMKEERLGPLTPTVYMDYVENIHKSGHHVLDIVNDVLDLSQIELDAKELQEEVIAVAETVDESCDMLETSAEERDIALRRTVPASCPNLLADRRMVKQMIINLLGNAIKFTQPGGRVGVLVSMNDQRELVIEVGDNGVGIDPDKIQDVLEPFSIAEPVESRRHGGVGLGLAITKRLIEHHGGYLELRSQKDVGTIVTLVFPANRVQGPPCWSGTV